MLQKALEFTRDVLDQFLRRKFALTDKVVVINNVISPNGDIPQENQNKLVISLLNIEQETNKQFYGRNQRNQTGDFSDVNPEQRYNLDVLFSSNFQDYSETLKILNATLSFFQAYNTIDRGVFSNLPKGMNRLDFDIEQISYHQMHSLWSAMGAKYQPSIIYKLRLISVQSDQTIRVLPEIVSATNNVQP